MTRIPVLFHADDAVVLASSRVEMFWSLSIVSWCAQDVKVEVHLRASKTVAQVLSHFVDDPNPLRCASLCTRQGQPLFGFA